MPRKYYLSAKACEGILRRAQTRGKELPQMLKDALVQMIEREKASTATTETSPEQYLRPSESTAGYQLDETASSSTNNDQYLFQPVPFCKSARARSADDATTWKDGKVANTLNTFDQGEARANELVVEKRLFENHSQDSRYKGPLDVSPMLSAQMGTGGNNQRLIVHSESPIAIDRAFFNQGQNAKYDPQYYTDGTVPTLTTRGPSAVSAHYIVRRLTPTECERLQGFPDGWTDIGDWTDSKGKKRKTTDSARYKALGNSIALPFWKALLKRISAQYDWDPTMASLFDGIGGFPYLWEQINGKGSCLWSSEIEEFPIAVTKLRIGETND